MQISTSQCLHVRCAAKQDIAHARHGSDKHGCHRLAAVAILQRSLHLYASNSMQTNLALITCPLCPRSFLDNMTCCCWRAALPSSGSLEAHAWQSCKCNAPQPRLQQASVAHAGGCSNQSASSSALLVLLPGAHCPHNLVLVKQRLLVTPRQC